MRFEVSMEGGTIPVSVDEGSAETAVILAHGAGSHMDHKTMVWLSGLVKEASDASVVRFNFLYRALGKGMPDRMPKLIETYRAVISEVRSQLGPRRLLIGGHSMGGRVASMLEAEGKATDGLILFGYPLHPPGQFDKMRDAHLPAISVPTLQINGTQDDFCDRALMEEVLKRLHPDLWRMFWIEGADHSYVVRKASGRTRADVAQDITSALREFQPLTS